MNTKEAAKIIGVRKSFLEYLIQRNLIDFVCTDNISMVECIRYKTEFALSRLNLLDRFDRMNESRDAILDELEKL